MYADDDAAILWPILAERPFVHPLDANASMPSTETDEIEPQQKETTSSRDKTPF